MFDFASEHTVIEKHFHAHTKHCMFSYQNNYSQIAAIKVSTRACRVLTDHGLLRDSPSGSFDLTQLHAVLVPAVVLLVLSEEIIDPDIGKCFKFLHQNVY